jgi:hypothetical protein
MESLFEWYLLFSTREVSEVGVHEIITQAILLSWKSIVLYKFYNSTVFNEKFSSHKCIKNRDLSEGNNPKSVEKPSGVASSRSSIPTDQIFKISPYLIYF